MAKICYTPKRFSFDNLSKVETANDIIEDYHAQGYDLTVRQLYYQFVARGYIPNNDKEYGKLQGLLNDARLAGLVDWDAIVDRSRYLRALEHFCHPRDILVNAHETFQFWKWENQPNYVEVWVEKDALVGIVGQACNPLDTPFFSCRGYTSVSEVHSAAMRFQHEINHGKTIRVIHIGDHDPSGLDMTRDIKNRLTNVFNVNAHIYRVALNRDQIDKFSPPPNPAKITDSRSDAYIEKHGEYSWELDSLDPAVLAGIIRSNILHWRDDEKWEAMVAKEQRAKNLLKAIPERWNEVCRLVKNPPEEE